MNNYVFLMALFGSGMAIQFWLGVAQGGEDDPVPAGMALVLLVGLLVGFSLNLHNIKHVSDNFIEEAFANETVQCTPIGDTLLVDSTFQKTFDSYMGIK